MGRTHRLAPALAVAALLGTTVACTGETNDTSADSDRTATNEEDFLKVYPLPFGLEHVEGTTAIGRPAVYDSIVLEYDGRPVVEGRNLKAAFVSMPRIPAPYCENGWIRSTSWVWER